MEKLSTEQTSILTTVAGLASTVGKLISGGVSTLEIAEKVVAVLDPALKPELDTLIAVLTEAQKLLGEV